MTFPWHVHKRSVIINIILVAFSHRKKFTPVVIRYCQELFQGYRITAKFLQNDMLKILFWSRSYSGENTVILISSSVSNRKSNSTFGLDKQVTVWCMNCTTKMVIHTPFTFGWQTLLLNRYSPERTQPIGKTRIKHCGKKYFTLTTDPPSIRIDQNRCDRCAWHKSTQRCSYSKLKNAAIRK